MAVAEALFEAHLPVASLDRLPSIKMSSAWSSLTWSQDATRPLFGLVHPVAPCSGS